MLLKEVMKPLPKLLMLLAAVAMLAFSHNASAVTVLDFNDSHILGDSVFAGFAPSDAVKTGTVNHLIGQTPNTTDILVPIDGHLFNIHRSANDFGPLPGPAVIALNGTGTNITIGSGVYSYLWATYTNGSSFHAEVWYIGNLSGDITIPGINGTLNLGGWTLFGPGVPGVPDGGTTAMLLGAALGALGMARRFLKA